MAGSGIKGYVVRQTRDKKITKYDVLQTGDKKKFQHKKFYLGNIEIEMFVMEK